jgi:tetratricopeptide (TPR) repeat protein
MQDQRASHPYGSLTPFRGRRRELDEAVELAAGALKKGPAAVLQLSGTRGRGKSRLVDELLIRLASLDIARPLVLRAGATAGVEPVARILRQRFGVDDTSDDDFAKWVVRGEMREILDDARVDDFSSAIVRLMGIHTTTPLLDALSPDDARKDVDRRVLCALLDRDARSRPVVVVVEDAHVFAATRELVQGLAEGLRGRVLLIVTTRQGLFASDGRDGPRAHKSMELGPLSASECELMIRDRLQLAARTLPGEVVEMCRSLAGGSPGLIDEALSALEGEGVLRRVDFGWKRSRFEVDLARLPDAAGTLSLNEAVEMRISALDPIELRLMRHAACAGSVFWTGAVVAQEYALLPPSDRLSPGEIAEALALLAERDFLLAIPDGAFDGETEYVIQQQLERDRVLRGIPLRERARRHLAVADWLEGRPETPGNSEHLHALAIHLEACAMPERSAAAFLDAAEAAHPGRPLRERVHLYERGLALLGDAHASRRIEALHAYGVALVTLGDSDGALAAFSEMLELAQALRRTSKVAEAERRIGLVHRERGDLRTARERLARALRLFSQAGDWGGVAATHDDLGRLEWMVGDYEPARDHVVAALEMRSAHRDAEGVASSLDSLALVEMDGGRTATAMEALTLALELHRERGDRVGVVHCLHDLGRLAQRQDDHVKALEMLLDAVDASCSTRGYPHAARLLTDLAESYLCVGNVEEAIRAAGGAEQLATAARDQFELGAVWRVQAKIHLERGEVGEARRSIDAAAAVCGDIDSHVLLAGVLRTLGEVTAAAGESAASECDAADWFVRAASLSNEHGAAFETAKTYRAFARCARTFPHVPEKRAVEREAERLDQLANEIFDRARADLDEDEWFSLRLAAVGGAPAQPS